MKVVRGKRHTRKRSTSFHASFANEAWRPRNEPLVSVSMDDTLLEPLPPSPKPNTHRAYRRRAPHKDPTRTLQVPSTSRSIRNDASNFLLETTQKNYEGIRLPKGSVLQQHGTNKTRTCRVHEADRQTGLPHSHPPALRTRFMGWREEKLRLLPVAVKIGRAHV